MRKVDVQKETDLSRYIPGRKGHLHHFAFVKLKKTSPTELQQLLQEHILEKENPEPISSAPKPALKMKRRYCQKLCFGHRAHPNDFS
jgi:hypothetical protein